MNHDFASSKEEIFQQQKVSFADIPNQSKLFIDYQIGSSNLAPFYPTKSKDIAEITKDVLDNYKVNRETLCQILIDENRLYGVDEKTYNNINKLREDDCVAVITGQQAGLFSGPIYTIYKALSAIKFAEDLSKQGIKAVPIFWIASEDHDFEEVSKTEFINSHNETQIIQNTPDDLKKNMPVGYIHLDSSIEKSISSFVSGITDTEFSEYIKSLLNNTYKNGETFSVTFGKQLAQMFNKFGLIFVSPLNNKLRKLCSPIFADAIEKSDLISQKLLARDEELKNKDYHSQVLVDDNFFPFFHIDKDKKRNSLRVDKYTQKVKYQDLTCEFTIQELIDIAYNSPISLSPNALMRPIVQDYLFPTICYFGGGAEIAYFGQNSVIYEALNRPVTPIKHRSSFTIIEGKHRRNLKKYNLEFKDLLDGKENILSEIIENYLNPETADIFVDVEEIINTQLNLLNQHLSKDEPTLSDNLANRRRKILWHIGALRKKFHKAETIKNEVVNNRIESLFTTVLPNNHLQERTINVLYFINLYGENFIDWIYHVVDAEERNHQVIIF